MVGRIREASGADEPFLIDMLYEALFVPPGKEPYPREIVDRPDLARYVRGFGRAPGDVGVIAELDGAPIGAAWVRQTTITDPGYGFVDESTPELSIAVVSGHRGQGVGTELLTALLGRLDRCSLAVDERNPARRLYERLGFEVVSHEGASVTMLASR